MASPFSVFRKNQKVWMAALVVMAMIAFVFFPQTMMNSGGRAGGRDAPVVRTTRFGNLGSAQLDTLRLNRLVFNEFLHNLASALVASKQTPNFVSHLMNVIGPASDKEVVDTWLFAREAEAMGITVDEKALNEFLTVLTNGSSREDILKILRGTRQGVSEATFLSILREELLALRYRQLFHQMQDADLWIGSTATPDERWTTFRRINEEAAIEVAVFLPQDFTKQIEDPSADKLKQFFEDHKESYASPYSPAPGFRVRRKVNIEYLQADEEKYRSSVTQAEITQRYEKDPQSYARDKEEFEKAEKEDKAEQAREDAAAKSAAEKKPETKDEKKAPASPPASKPAEGKKPADGKNPAPANSKPAVETKPSGAPKGPDPAKAAPAAKSSGSSREVRRSPFRLVALAEDKPGEKAAPSKDEKKAPASPPAAPPASKPAEGKKPADDKRPAAKSTAADTAKKVDDGSKMPPHRPIKTAEQRLRDKIRNEIAQEKLQANLAKIQTLLANYRQEWTNYDAGVKNKSDAQKPTPPDFAALAREYGMSAGRTGLISQIELRELDLGKSVNRQQRREVDQLMFDATTLYKPEVSDDMGMNRIYFVFWKTDDQSERIPKWEDPGIQAEVLRVWKLSEARKRALKQAEELKAEAAAHSGSSLKKLASGKNKDFTVLRPPQFTFLTRMFGLGELQLGEVFGLEKVGADFMQKVFGLAPNQVDVAANRPQTEIYVIRALEFTPFKDLWASFISDADEWTLFTHVAPSELGERLAGLRQMIGKEQGEVWRAWHDNVYADAGVKWEEPADERSRPGQGPGPSPIGDE
jgi:hypothetical protein